MAGRGSTLLVATVLAIVLGVTGALLPVPYVALSPNPSTDTLGTVGNEPLIVITGHETYPTTGHLNLTTIALTGDLDLRLALQGWLDHKVAVVPRELVFRPGLSNAQVDAENKAEMQQSQQSATTAALRQLGIPVRTAVTVGTVQPGSPAAGALSPGDVVTAVDGVAVASAEDLRKAVSARRPGDRVSITYTRAGASSTAQLQTIAAPKEPARAVVGVTLKEEQQYPFTVRIRLEMVGGPSAGLMFALGIIDKLTPEDITGGRFIAGTGEISDDGTVGPIGGIQQKLIGARRDGATVFLTPAANCAEARDATPKGLRLIRVQALQDALSSLATLRSGGNPPTCS